VVFVMWAMGVLAPIVISFVVALSIASVHSIMRPVVNEFYFIHKPKPKVVPTVVHSDGYVDSQEEDEDELTFSKQFDVASKENGNPNANIRRRSLEGKNHVY